MWSPKCITVYSPDIQEAQKHELMFNLYYVTPIFFYGVSSPAVLQLAHLSGRGKRIQINFYMITLVSFHP